MTQLMLPGALDSVLSLQTIIDLMPNPVFVKDRQHRFILINREAAHFFDVPQDELLGKSDLDSATEDEIRQYRAADNKAFDGGQTVECEELFADRAGKLRQIVTRKMPVTIADGTKLLIVVIIDVTEVRQAEAHNRYLAFHDPLTGLGNRALLLDRMGSMCSVACDKPVALILIDLDRFKEVNDSLGHPAGDELLLNFADRLLSCTAPDDLVVRLGGDEFIVLLSDTARVNQVGDAVLSCAQAPFLLGEMTVEIGASIGIASSSPDCRSPSELKRRADVALYQSKADGRSRISTFSADMDRGRVTHREIESCLRKAQSDFAQFALVYQPEVKTETGEVACYEALLRWQHPGKGQIAPSQFIPIAEETGLIVALGYWVLRTAMRDVAALGQHANVAVNVSPVQLRAPDFFRQVQEIASTIGFPLDRLEIELTETAVFHASAIELDTIKALRSAGVKVALDDFGTGYSTLSHLRQLAVDKIKIDRTFVRSLGQTSDAAAIIDAVVGLGRSLGITTTAEGVETEEQRDILRQAGCTELQGYLISRPRPIAEIAARLPAERSRTSPRGTGGGAAAGQAAAPNPVRMASVAE